MASNKQESGFRPPPASTRREGRRTDIERLKTGQRWVREGLIGPYAAEVLPALRHGLQRRGWREHRIFQAVCREELCMFDFEGCPERLEAKRAGKWDEDTKKMKFNCPNIDMLHDYWMEVFRQIPWIQPDLADQILCSELAYRMVRRDYAINLMDKFGGPVVCASAQTNTTAYRTYTAHEVDLKAIDKLADKLGLNPRSRARMGVDLADYELKQSAIQQLREKKALEGGGGQIVDAEYTDNEN